MKLLAKAVVRDRTKSRLGRSSKANAAASYPAAPNNSPTSSRLSTTTQINARRQQARVPGRCLHLGERPTIRESVRGKRVPPVVDRQCA
jgi:hypothetical protein